MSLRAGRRCAGARLVVDADRDELRRGRCRPRRARRARRSGRRPARPALSTIRRSTAAGRGRSRRPAPRRAAAAGSADPAMLGRTRHSVRHSGAALVVRATAESARWPIRVFLLDDHEIVRRGLRELLEAEDDIEVVGEAAPPRRRSAASPPTRPTSPSSTCGCPTATASRCAARSARAHPEIALPDADVVRRRRGAVRARSWPAPPATS